MTGRKASWLQSRLHAGMQFHDLRVGPSSASGCGQNQVVTVPHRCHAGSDKRQYAGLAQVITEGKGRKRCGQQKANCFKGDGLTDSVFGRSHSWETSESGPSRVQIPVGVGSSPCA